jgi:hypothetical protein
MQRLMRMVRQNCWSLPLRTIRSHAEHGIMLDHAELFVVVAVTVRSDRLSAVVPRGMILPRGFKPANQADWRKALWQDLFRRKPILTRLADGAVGTVSGTEPQPLKQKLNFTTQYICFKRQSDG